MDSSGDKCIKKSKKVRSGRVEHQLSLAHDDPMKETVFSADSSSHDLDEVLLQDQ